MPRLLSFLAACLLAFSASADEKPPKPAEPKKANRLAKETSPYLLQHAHNPVDWHPWGLEAFEKAKKENKLVFLSIGYSSCHWCHVMEKESFSNEEVAKIMNSKFVCIKVDREERPDVDHIYMTALQALEQRGGWPMSMFLTADGKPIVGGTYWPREDREIDGKKMRGFKTVLNAVADAWEKQRKEVEDQAESLAKTTIAELEGLVRGLPILEIKRELLTASVEEVLDQFDPEHGGFGPAGGTKFPMPPRLILLEEEVARSKSTKAAKVLDLTLDRMARGGIYDHLGGGFHRYSTERTWLIPHFEKMLYDNAQLVEVYSRAFQRTKSPVHRRVIEETLAFIEREMTSPEGAFYSALDADSDGDEGKFYIWTGLNIAEALPESADQKLIRNVYGADKANFEEKYRIFHLPKSLAEKAKELETTEAELIKRLEPLKKKLFETRAKRPRPFLDTKVLTAWNGQMIAGYAAAGEALGEKKYLDVAAKAANFMLTKMRTKDGRLLRTYGAAPGQKPEARLNAYLDDYAFLVHGLLCLHDATKDKKWLDEAKALTDVMVKQYQDEKAGGFYYTSGDHEKLFARAKDQFDGAQPSGNSMAARNLVRLWVKTNDDKYKTLAEKSIRSMALPMKQNPMGVCTLASAIGIYLDAQKK